jgi:hypothetical protein
MWKTDFSNPVSRRIRDTTQHKHTGVKLFIFIMLNNRQ